jgi:hypothetical protein
MTDMSAVVDPVRPTANKAERVRTNVRPIAQWSRQKSGRSDELTPK